MKDKYFAIYFVCFGEVEEVRFRHWADLEFFKRQLRPNQLVNFGCLDTQFTNQKVAA